ncbi:MAG: hypothetical protein JSR66_02320 [Proteobacteria bacterium]|nr:hypothetical protein [Pseudomonadota bacterium]
MKNYTLATAAIAGLTITMSAYAGFSSTKTVLISRSATTTIDSVASGSVPSAHHSPDTSEFIGCGISTGPTATSAATLTCQAQDSAGHSLVCQVTSPPLFMTATVSAVRINSFIQFQVNSRGQCTDIKVDNSSQYLHPAF